MIDEGWRFIHAKKNLPAVDIDVLFHRTPRGVHLGGRGAKDLKAFLKSFPEAGGGIAVADDLGTYEAASPKGAHFVGKTLTQRLESLNANLRHSLARFARRTRCTTKCKRMAYLSALLFMQKHNES